MQKMNFLNNISHQSIDNYSVSIDYEKSTFLTLRKIGRIPKKS